MKPQVVYVSSRRPWPPVSGREHMICQSLETLADDFDITYCLIGQKWTGAGIPRTIHKAIALPGPSVLEILFNLIYCRGLSLQERIFFRRSSARIVKKLIADIDAAIVAVDMVRMSTYLPEDDAVTICDMDDLLSMRYRQLASVDLRKFDIFGTHKDKFLFKFLSVVSKPILRRILLTESKLIGRREVQIAKEVDLVLMVSPVEKTKLSEAIGDRQKIVAFPPAVEIPSVTLVSDRLAGKQGDVSLLFVGDMRTPANALAVELLANQILPEFGKRVGGFRAVFVGRADSRVSDLIAQSGNSVHLGWVDDLSKVYSEADIVVCPFVAGTGVKLKVLQAMSYGKAIVTNSLGVEGIAGHSGVHFLVADDVPAIVDSLVDLANNIEFRQKLGMAARALIAQDHDPATVRANLRSKVLFLSGRE